MWSAWEKATLLGNWPRVETGLLMGVRCVGSEGEMEKRETVLGGEHDG
jgi:hypothetical protein